MMVKQKLKVFITTLCFKKKFTPRTFMITV